MKALSKSLFILGSVSALSFGACVHSQNSAQAKNQESLIQHVSPKQVPMMFRVNPDIIILDVRTPLEYKRGHMDGAVSLNYASFKFKSRLAKLDKDAAYLVHCKSGHRSMFATKAMERAGFTTIYEMDGGYDGWKKRAQKPSP